MFPVLTGLRVVELAAFIAAPMGGMALAQLGATVIRIDALDGNADFRRWPLTRDGESLYWAGLNKAKRSVRIDLASPEGRELAAALIAAPGPDAGILLTNFPMRGWLARAALDARRADLISLAITGDHTGRTAVDYTVNCAVGYPLMTGHATPDAPVNHVLPAWDAITGMHAATGLLAAERHRRLTGEGRHISLALADVAFATIGHLGHIAEWEINGAERAPIGNDLYGAFGRDFGTRDGRRVMVVAITDRQWRGLVAATGMKEACAAIARERGLDLDDEGQRFAARDAIAAHVAPWCAARTLAEIAAAFDAAGVCWGPYQSIAQAIAEDPRCSPANPLFERVTQPGIGTMLMPGTPLRFAGLQPTPVAPAPRLGADTDAVLSEILGLSAAAIGRLHDRGVVGGVPA